MKKVAICQSNYIPWKGYFDMINSVDEFIIYDDMQFTKRDWRNRNVIKSPNGLLWLTIPVKVKGKFNQTIRETKVEGSSWAETHWKSLRMNYSKAAFFNEFAADFELLYQQAAKKEFLSDINFLFISEICRMLEIVTPLKWSHDFQLKEGKTERLVDLCLQSSATSYISGPAARDYIVAEQFSEVGMELKWMDYTGYEIYPQKFGEFCHGVSILDLIL
jgi:hypothetical protein